MTVIVTITCDGTARTINWPATCRLNGTTSPSVLLAVNSVNKFYLDSPLEKSLSTIEIGFLFFSKACAALDAEGYILYSLCQ